MSFEQRLITLRIVRKAMPEHDRVLREVEAIMTRLHDAPRELKLSALVSQDTGEPKVDVVWMGTLLQLTPDEARATAWLFIEAAATAETEAFLVAFLRDRFKLNADEGALMLADLRAFREQQLELRRRQTC